MASSLRAELRPHRMRSGTRPHFFEENGWTVPKTYDEMLALGAEAKGKGKYLLGWGKEAANYYQTMAISSAIKEGGDEVRLALENLKPDCWSLLRFRTSSTG